jgi:HNH endonuclease
MLLKRFFVSKDMIKVELSQGFTAFIDDGDFELINNYKWHVSLVGSKVKQAMCNTVINGKPTKLSMHRLLMKPLVLEVVDHIDGNPLNNQKCNLRLCSPTENQYNRPRTINNQSAYKGVWETPSGKFRSYIKVDSKRINLGTFTTAELASKAYKDASKQLHGQFSVYNRPENA